MSWVIKVKEVAPPTPPEKGLGLLLLAGIVLYALSKKR